MNKIGYACITMGMDRNYRTLRAKNISDDYLKDIIEYNLNLLEDTIDYNYNNNIFLYRISSDIIPFGSSKLNTFDWRSYFSNKLKKIGNKIKNYNMRVSMHPGQYTIINSPREDVVKNSINDLIYHCDFMDLMGLDCTNKMIIHIGGVYGNKEESIRRFVSNYKLLSSNIKCRVVIENDDKSYNINDVMEISNIINVPVVYDNLHNEINNYDHNSDIYWINIAGKTWDKKDGIQKIHYSQQAIGKKKGSHSDTIDVDVFKKLYNKLNNIDIMLEVKDKDISVIRCMKAVGE
ncbi:MAG: UV DNA damage repair endonuclease UvsE [Bacilli bacterium]|nr:UV DNA damage repair endonuclease UvsE [Bacilli bacterium]